MRSMRYLAVGNKQSRAYSCCRREHGSVFTSQLGRAAGTVDRLQQQARRSLRSMASHGTVLQQPAAREEAFYATCHPGLESVVADELRAHDIGAVGVEPGRAGVHFRHAAEASVTLLISSVIQVVVA